MRVEYDCFHVVGNMGMGRIVFSPFLLFDYCLPIIPCSSRNGSNRSLCCYPSSTTAMIFERTRWFGRPSQSLLQDKSMGFQRWHARAIYSCLDSNDYKSVIGAKQASSLIPGGVSCSFDRRELLPNGGGAKPDRHFEPLSNYGKWIALPRFPRRTEGTGIDRGPRTRMVKIQKWEMIDDERRSKIVL